MLGRRAQGRRGVHGAMAAPAESVAAVLEMDRLVRLAWSPPRIVGLCPFRGEVIPIVRLRTPSSGVGIGLAGGSAGAAGSDSVAASVADSIQVRNVLLILRSARGAWGVVSDSAWTIMSQECPQAHPPRQDDDGPVLVGVIEHAGILYEILDPEATWQSLRSAILRWYGRPGETATVTSTSPGTGQGEGDEIPGNGLAQARNREVRHELACA
jgi:chemotaxis signal transduction protein